MNTEPAFPFNFIHSVHAIHRDSKENIGKMLSKQEVLERTILLLSFDMRRTSQKTTRLTFFYL
jgi:hypothetical protein